MDFFAHQDAARRTTRRLVVLFVLAVAAIVVAVYLAVVLILLSGELRTVAGGFDLWTPRLFVPVAAATLLVIGAGSGYKTLQLAGGGSAVGRLLGGRPLDPNSSDPEERRILNVVEEMAIAAGTPVPDVYLLGEERAINAFAAGRTPHDAVIGITRGTARLLSRDELQGVVAHELSHVLNGDMRLNLRLMGLLHGILVISMIGYFAMRTGGGASSRRRGKGGAGAIVLLGLALYLIGWIGVFFGRLIKAAVSRQREFLADAAAVQFTRNPLGIGGALRKIGGYRPGSRIRNRSAEEASHLFFSDALKKHLLGVTATHPPLEERIRRIDPAFDGTFPDVEWPDEEPIAAPSPVPPAAGRASRPVPDVVGGAVAAGVLLGAGGGVVDSVGTLDTEHLAFATTLLAELPGHLRAVAREPASARALVFAALLDAERAVRVRQLEELRRTAEPAVVDEVRALVEALAAVPAEARIPLIDLALPALRRMSPEQYRTFRASVDALARADGRISLFEYALHRVLLRHLDPHFGKPRERAVQYYGLQGLGSEVSCLLSLLARAGAHEDAAVAAAFAAAAGELAGTGAELALQAREECGLKALDLALDRLAVTAPRLKKQVLRAAVAAVAHDRRVTPEEGELLRAVADGLDCPVPPFLRP
jgi:Zn-dependent protease with chaperone function